MGPTISGVEVWMTSPKRTSWEDESVERTMAHDAFSAASGVMP